MQSEITVTKNDQVNETNLCLLFLLIVSRTQKIAPISEAANNTKNNDYGNLHLTHFLGIKAEIFALVYPPFIHQQWNRIVVKIGNIFFVENNIQNRK